MNDRKEPRWISVLIDAQAHRDLTVSALDKGTTLGELVKVIIMEFLEKEKVNAT